MLSAKEPLVVNRSIRLSVNDKRKIIGRGKARLIHQLSPRDCAAELASSTQLTEAETGQKIKAMEFEIGGLSSPVCT